MDAAVPISTRTAFVFGSTSEVAKASPVLCASPETVAHDLLRRPNKRGIEYLPWWLPLMLLIRLLPAPLAAKL